MFATIAAKTWIDSLSEICEPYINDIANLSNVNKSLINVFDVLGRIANSENRLQIRVYDDGSTEKNFILK